MASYMISFFTTVIVFLKLFLCCKQAGECSVSFVEVHNTVAGSLKIDMSDSTAVNPSASDQEELGSDKDVPYFSDVEAMVIV